MAEREMESWAGFMPWGCLFRPLVRGRGRRGRAILTRHGLFMTESLQQRPLRWESLTWEEIGSLRQSGMDLCLLPVGATEQHGPHLGVGMDSRNATLLCEAVSRE